jgi:hypothetical protein
VTANQFYEQLLVEIGVDEETMQDARTKRDELAAISVGAIGQRIERPRPVRVGALAQGTQIHPLNDVDQVIELPYLLDGWLENPLRAMTDVASWLQPHIDGRITLSTHAIKIEYSDKEFTADLVIGWKQQKGILIPHCPDDEPHRWIPTDPETHKEQVLARNRTFQPGRAIFSRQIRMIKHLNCEWQLRYELDRKPLSSFHVTALGLEILKTKAGHDEWTPLFLGKAAKLVLEPLPDPADVGDPIEAPNPQLASPLLAEAAVKTQEARSESDAEPLLREVFGYPGRRRIIVSEPTVSVGAGGALGVGSAAIVRSTPPVRSHGEAV